MLESHLFTFGIEFMVCHMGAPLYFTCISEPTTMYVVGIKPTIGKRVVIQGFHCSMMGIFAT